MTSMIGVMMLAAVPAYASTITDVVYEASSFEVGSASNQTLVFTTLSGVLEGQTMIFTFSDSFTLSQLTEDDIDLSHDGADLTTASNCTGVEQASVSIVGQILTVELCSGDQGTISAGSTVRLEIGTNATSSGTGIHTIINPFSTGTFFLSVSGTFGDSGSIVIPITPGTQKTVTATVPSQDVGGGGSQIPPESGGGSPSDSLAPNICCVVVSEVTENTATISWQTDESANSYVDYGKTTDYELVGLSQTEIFQMTHTLSLTNLEPGTTYHIRVRSQDDSGNEAASSDYTFVTQDITSPVISSLQVQDISETSARIVWTTDEPTKSQIFYGTTSAYGSSVYLDIFEEVHSLLLTNLSPGTLYYFAVQATDVFLNKSLSSDQTFTTLVNEPPTNIFELAVIEGDTILSYSWKNPQDADILGIQMRCRTDKYPTSPTDGTLVFDELTESFVWSGRENGTSYYCTFYAYDQALQFSSGAIIIGTPHETQQASPVSDESEINEPVTDDQDIPLEDESKSDQAEENSDSGQETKDEPLSTDTGSQTTSDQESSTSQEEDHDSQEEGSEGNGSSQLIQQETSDSQEEKLQENVSSSVKQSSSSFNFDSAQTRFFVANRMIELIPKNDVLHVLGTKSLHVEFAIQESNDYVIDYIQFVFGSNAYLLEDSENGLYQADIITPSKPGIYPMIFTMFFHQADVEFVEITAQVETDGFIFIENKDTTQAVAGLPVLILDVQTNTVWDAYVFGQSNPLTSSTSGQIAWYIPNGMYELQIVGEKYRLIDTNSFSVTDALLRPVIKLEEIPAILPQQINQKIDQVKEIIVTQAQETKTVILKQAKVAQETLETVREIPAVQTSTKVAIPVVVTTAAATTTVLASSFSLFPFLQYLFTSPLLFWHRRKRMGYGTVYNATTKAPIDLAIVRLYQSENHKLLQSRVTDKGGRFFFLVSPGRYRLEVKKPEFIFPSDYLRGVKQDVVYTDLYHQEEIIVKDSGAMITPNIPLDPKEPEKYQTPAAIRRLKYLRIIQRIVASVGMMVSLIIFILLPTIFTGLIFIGQILIHLLVRRLAIPPKP
ncbi:hypothetical protein CO172_01650, partial [Candidatus Uhrbacteria bacterium CG_4_9_14_3_um_filter_36_7]